LAFFGLTFAVGHQPVAQPTHWVQGNDLLDEHSTHGEGNLQAVRGTVDRVGTKVTGSRTIHLIADDGAPILISVPPTVSVRMPKSGDRIGVVGSVITPGTLTLNGRDQLQFLPPATNSSRRREYFAQLENIERLPSGAHRATVVGVHGEFVTTALIQAGIAIPHKKWADSGYMMKGYVGSDGTYVVESLE
jgi:hypothetical protein